jgi:hypothetical protein
LRIRVHLLGKFLMEALAAGFDLEIPAVPDLEKADKRFVAAVETNHGRTPW